MDYLKEPLPEIKEGQRCGGCEVRAVCPVFSEGGLADAVSAYNNDVARLSTNSLVVVEAVRFGNKDLGSVLDSKINFVNDVVKSCSGSVEIETPVGRSFLNADFDIRVNTRESSSTAPMSMTYSRSVRRAQINPNESTPSEGLLRRRGMKMVKSGDVTVLERTKASRVENAQIAKQIAKHMPKSINVIRSDTQKQLVDGANVVQE